MIKYYGNDGKELQVPKGWILHVYATGAVILEKVEGEPVNWPVHCLGGERYCCEPTSDQQNGGA